jgi:hypothetical protein
LPVVYKWFPLAGLLRRACPWAAAWMCWMATWWCL